MFIECAGNQNKIPVYFFLFQIIGMFYIFLVALLIGTNLRKLRKKKKTSLNKNFVMRFRERNGVTYEIVEGDTGPEFENI